MCLVLLAGCQTHPDSNDDPNSDETVKSIEKKELHGTYITWYGRHHHLNDDEYFYYTASGFKIIFTGRVIDIELKLFDKNADIYFTVSKNGTPLLEGETLVLSESVQIFRITFDTYDLHQIEIIKRSEPEDGVTALSSVVTNGKLEKQIATDTEAPHFLLIGASGISGHGALGTAGESRTTQNSSSLHAFGHLTAAAFDGTFEFVSNSGWGLAFGFNDISGTQNIAKAYESIGIDANQQVLDIAYEQQKRPDIIIVNIGGNDYSAVINQLSGFEKQEKINEFKNAVASFVLKLRSDVPNAHIFWTMTSGSQNGNAALSVFELLDEEDKAFIHMVVILGVGEQGDPVGANNHSSFITHQKSAAILAQAIQTYANIA